MNLFSSKKAQGEEAPKQLVGFILAFLFIVASIPIILGVMNIFSKTPDSGSIVTLNFAYEAVTALHHPSNADVKACKILNRHIQPDWAIVGFNKDGVKSADEDIVCKMGFDCVEEQCNTFGEQEIIKPLGECGSGPCICLCNGGGGSGLGDVDGDDCMEDGAECRKFAPDVGFDTFYLWYAESDAVIGHPPECPEKLFQKGSSTTGSICDLVLDSEGCLGGVNRDVMYALVIEKNPAIKGVIFDYVASKEEFDDRYTKDTYPKMPECNDLLKAEKEQPKEEEKKPDVPVDQGQSAIEQLDEEKPSLVTRR